MYIQQISIDINSTHNINEIIDEFGLLLSFYRGNGQTQGYKESQFYKNNKIVCLPYSLEKDSLLTCFNNFYVNQQIKKIEELDMQTKIGVLVKLHFYN